MTLEAKYDKLENVCFYGPGPRPVASLGLPRPAYIRAISRLNSCIRITF